MKSEIAVLRAQVEILKEENRTAYDSCSETNVALAQAFNEIAALRAALGKINDIRNSIIGLQTVNWSEHIYPLVAVLDGCGIEGQSYQEARESVGTMFERLTRLNLLVEELERENGRLRAVLAELVASEYDSTGRFPRALAKAREVLGGDK